MTFFIKRIIVLGHGLIFQPVLTSLPSTQTYTYNIDIIVALQKVTLQITNQSEYTTDANVTVREPEGPIVPSPPPSPHPQEPTIMVKEMYLRVSRTQSHLFPGQPLRCKGLPPAFSRPPTERSSLTH